MSLEGDWVAFSPTKELKKSGSEEGGFRLDSESSASEGLPDFPSPPSSNHFRGSSFGDSLSNPYVSQSLPSFPQSSKNAEFELERALQRNQELIELLTAKEGEITRLRDDLEEMKSEIKVSLEREIGVKEVIRRLEKELVRCK